VKFLETRFWEKLVEGSFWENLENKLKRRGLTHPGHNPPQGIVRLGCKPVSSSLPHQELLL
jgi:hypothetical protein